MLRHCETIHFMHFFILGESIGKHLYNHTIFLYCSNGHSISEGLLSPRFVLFRRFWVIKIRLQWMHESKNDFRLQGNCQFRKENSINWNVPYSCTFHINYVHNETPHATCKTKVYDKLFYYLLFKCCSILLFSLTKKEQNG